MAETRSTAARYLELTKPKVVALIVFTAVVGMVLAVPGSPPLVEFIAGTLGIGLAAGSAAAINHLLAQRIDAVMARTRNRPLPSGQLGINQVLTFALVLAVVSMTLLVVFVRYLDNRPDLDIWHLADLDAEFVVDHLEQIGEIESGVEDEHAVGVLLCRPRDAGKRI